MASILGDTTCVTHADRVSSARCPSCHQFYCSECITEHNGKMICAGCLKKQLAEIQPKQVTKRRSLPFLAMIQFVVAVLIAWMVFYFFAQTLADIPDDFHDGTIWE